MRDSEYQDLLVEVAQLRGAMEAHKDLLLRDPEFMEALRARAWLRADRSRVRLDAGGTSVECPDGWPVGIDPRAYATRFLETRQRREELSSAIDDLEADG